MYALKMATSLTLPGPPQKPEEPSGPRRPAPHPPPVGPALIRHPTPTLHTHCLCVCVCVVQIAWRQWWQSFLWAAVCSLQGYSPPAPPVDGSEEDAEWAGSELLISCAVKVRRCRRPQPSRLLLLSLKRYRALNEFFIFTFLISMDWSFARCVFGLVWLTVTETEKYSMCRKKDKSKSSYQIFGIFALHFFIFNN